ncbi:MAG: hypothetical protein CENE_02762 [Candidatus Celerinatantimonas neptuna]|nr:MAG: hypothetical protein CENE_02762 [Candidatus Celerinatantimonas neptuna]
MDCQNAKVKLAQRFMDHVWQEKAYRETQDFLTPQLIIKSPVRESVGSEHLSDTFDIWFRAFPELIYRQREVCVCGNWVSIDWFVEGDHLGEFFGISATGRRIQYSGTTSLLLFDNRIHSYRATVSISPLIAQISPNTEIEIHRIRQDMFAQFNRIIGVNLSQRQIECLALSSLSHNQKMISEKMGIRYTTFRTHLERALQALGLSSAKDIFDWSLSKHVLELLIHIGMNQMSCFYQLR